MSDAPDVQDSLTRKHLFFYSSFGSNSHHLYALLALLLRSKKEETLEILRSPTIVSDVNKSSVHPFYPT